MELWDQACELHKRNRFEEAEDIYVQLLEQNPDNTGLMATLGSLYVQTGRIGLAIHFLEAAKGGLKQCDVFTNLGIGYKRAGFNNKARVMLEEALKNDPSPETLAAYSGYLIESGQDAKCIEMCERAIAGNPELSTAHWNMAISLLSEGQWARGWDEHEWGLKTKGIREVRKVLDVPVWDGKSLGTVLVYGEQGMGDEIMFSSMLPDLLKTNQIVFECHQRLKNLFSKAFPGVPIYGTREDAEVSWADNHKIDYRIPIGSLGQFYRRSREAFPGTPYLDADPLPRGDKFRVGISWIGGGAKMGRIQKRSVPLQWWKPILDIPDIEFVSLQYTKSDDDIDVMGALGYDIKKTPEAHAEDYYEAARLVASCDLVISVCTSVIHLAGALGVPCWVMTPKHPAWRYQNSGGMPWYRSVRLYRSPMVEVEGWAAVIELIGHDLKRLVTPQIQRVA